jgi:SAM-dependent methyltransferase
LKQFDQPIPKEKLDIFEKTRSNLFAWRGQFSPQLIEVILSAYCPSNSVILDPFTGSGTVLREAGILELEAYGCEINPAAFILSKIYEFINDSNRKQSLNNFRRIIDREFPFRIFDPDAEVEYLAEKLIKIRGELDQKILMIFDALVILLDLANNKITNEFIQAKFSNLIKIIESLPYSEKTIKVALADARSLPLKNDQIDFVVTSPPYINVFNYHQNYRQSTELLGWDILKIARSEIGSNRANRKNRFYTVVQYCLDLADTIKEISRVTKKEARIIFIVGHQSNVLGVPFYNADIIEKIGVKTHLFHKILRQKREFKNKFGQLIREDIISFVNLNYKITQEKLEQVAKEVAFDVLTSNLSLVSPQNLKFLEDAIQQINKIQKTPTLDQNIFSSLSDQPVLITKY